MTAAASGAWACSRWSVPCLNCSTCSSRTAAHSAPTCSVSVCVSLMVSLISVCRCNVWLASLYECALPPSATTRLSTSGLRRLRRSSKVQSRGKKRFPTMFAMELRPAKGDVTNQRGDRPNLAIITRPPTWPLALRTRHALPHGVGFPGPAPNAAPAASGKAAGLRLKP
jgi:hypothetical protein